MTSSIDFDLTGPIPANQNNPTDTSAEKTLMTGNYTRNLQLETLTTQAGDLSHIVPGHVIKGRFRLEKPIGKGGMGTVWVATDLLKAEASDRNPQVAMKILNEEFRQHPDALKALQREARKSQQLNHDNIVRVYDFDREGVAIYMTMELVEGRALNEIIRDPEFKGMPLAEAEPIVRGIGAALTRAHDAGIVHSDFKPGNVLLSKDGIPKVFDFGIARAAANSDTAEKTVFDAGSLGAMTPAYASLEMLDDEEPDTRDDIYALALTIYELLTGERAYGKNSAAVALKKKLSPKRPKTLSSSSWKALKKGLALRRADRSATVDELVDGVLGQRKEAGSKLPKIAASLVGLALLAGAAMGGKFLLERQSASAYVDAVVAGEHQGNAAIVAAYRELDPAAAAWAVAQDRDRIVAHFNQTAAAAWNPTQQAYDYAAATDAYDTLAFFAPELIGETARKRQQIEAERAKAIEAQVAKLRAALASDDKSGTADALATIRKLDPQHPLVNRD